MRTAIQARPLMSERYAPSVCRPLTANQAYIASRDKRRTTGPVIVFRQTRPASTIQQHLSTPEVSGIDGCPNPRRLDKIARQDGHCSTSNWLKSRRQSVARGLNFSTEPRKPTRGRITATGAHQPVANCDVVCRRRNTRRVGGGRPARAVGYQRVARAAARRECSRRLLLASDHRAGRGQPRLPFGALRLCATCLAAQAGD
jgi:hypothetical protein